MISVRDAFHADTTVTCFLSMVVVGTWDEKNQWVEGSLSEPVKFKATPFPAGNVSEAVFGESLKVELFGERTPEFKRFFSRTEMPMNSVITHRDKKYKVIRIGDYKDGGYFEVLAAKLLEQT